jgi:hypothetical protein
LPVTGSGPTAGGGGGRGLRIKRLRAGVPSAANASGREYPSAGKGVQACGPHEVQEPFGGKPPSKGDDPATGGNRAPR